MKPPRVATYRVQLTPDFGFAQAAEVVADIASLGVSHIYISPVATAVRGSTHGYDVVRPWEVRGELGGEEGLWHLARTVRHAGMGLIIDVVPNHVATTEPRRNPWWWSLLASGSDSDAADYFDVDWTRGDGKVIVPTLGSPLAEAIDAGDLHVVGDELVYFDKTFPLARDPARRGTDPGSGDMDELLEHQHFKLTHWRSPERNVRRFFTIDDLAAVRPEVDEVADAIASTAEQLANGGLLEGVRVDHIDGLAEPGAYLKDLRTRLGSEAWLLVEKILVGDEALPTRWPTDGTTGYEWIGLVDHLFTNPDAEATFTRLAASAVGRQGYHQSEQAAVREVLTGELRPDLERLARVAAVQLDDDGQERIEPPLLIEPLIELTAHLGRYRTYLPTDLMLGAGSAADPAPGDDPGVDREVAVLMERADRARSGLEPEQCRILDRMVKVIVAGTEVTRRWQQLSGPALAKGGEDRALYRWIRLGAHNEVGGDPGLWTTSLDAFHEHNAHVCTNAPYTLLAGSTHDTKRSEDARARLLALTEIPRSWDEAVAEWTGELIRLHAPLDTLGGQALSLCLQTLVAAWPIDAERLGDYLIKASREANLRTSWTEPDRDHEEALRQLCELVTDDAFAHRAEAVLAEVDPIARSIALAQLALRLTAPGVPDLYQGSERWLHTLVDPDNRGPFDIEALRATVREADTTTVWDGPVTKAALIKRVLGARASTPECFEAGSGYQPIRATGTHGDHVVAFMRTPPTMPATVPSTDSRGTGSPDTRYATTDSARTHHSSNLGKAQGMVTVASRFPASRGGWGDTRIALPRGSWNDVLTGGRSHAGPTMLSDLLAENPAAVLLSRS